MLTVNQHIYLISDSTGETVSTVARSIYARFENINFIENKWALIRTEKQIDNIVEIIKEKRGIVLYTMINLKLENYLIGRCDDIRVSSHNVLDNTINKIKKFYEIQPVTSQAPGMQHSLSEDYFDRIESLQYAIANDDGQGKRELEKADIIFFGVSRTSKTPTSIYLANKGYKVANIPYVLNQNIDLSNINRKTLVIGLFASPERLQQIRTSRLQSLKENKSTNYINIEILKKEVEEAKKICTRNKWSTIDVTKKSIEEIAATALEYLKIFRKQEILNEKTTR
jgi:regulator of PEP synthase PpsR (kinase-PPPase family)